MGMEYIRQIMVLGQVPSLGPVILFDDMEGVLKWTAGGSGAGYAVTRDGTIAYNGSYSLKCVSRVAGAVEGDVVSCYRYIYPRPGERYKLECLFNHVSDADTKMLRFSVAIDDLAYLWYAEIRYDAINHKLQYLTLAGAWVDVVGGSVNLYATGWHRFSFSFNKASGKYISVTLDGKDISLEGIDMYSTGSGAVYYGQVTIEGTAGASCPANYYIEDILIMEI
jgi:hypothetical protein